MGVPQQVLLPGPGKDEAKGISAGTGALAVAAVDPIFLFCVPPYTDEEGMKNEDLPRGLAAGLCSASRLCDQGPPRDLYVPCTTLSAVLSSARVATSSSYLQPEKEV